MTVAPPSQQGRAYTRAEIEQRLRGGLEVLMADGSTFRELSVEQLRLSAGISRSSYYRHFSDKADMLAALESGALDRLYESQRQWVAKGAACTRQDVHDGMCRLIERFREEEAIMRAVAEASAYEPTIHAAYARGVGGYARAIGGMVRKLQASGRRQHLDPVSTGTALAWMTERTVLLEVPGAPPRRRRAIASALTDVISATLLEDE